MTVSASFTDATPRRDGRMVAALVAIAVAAIVAIFVYAAVHRPGELAAPAAPRLAALPAQPTDAPVLAPVSVLAPADARARNAADPFATGPLTPAAPFRFRGSSADRAQATECLAL